VGILKGLFGGQPEKGKAGRPKGSGSRNGAAAGESAGAPPSPAEAAIDQLVGQLRREGGGPRVLEVTVDSSPRQVCRYVFQRLMAGTPAAALRADLLERGFPGKVADGYIELIQRTLFKGK